MTEKINLLTYEFDGVCYEVLVWEESDAYKILTNVVTENWHKVFGDDLKERDISIYTAIRLFFMHSSGYYGISELEIPERIVNDTI